MAVGTAAEGRRFDAGSGQALAAANGDVREQVAVMGQRTIAFRSARVQRLLQASIAESVSIESLTRQPTMRRAITPMTNDTYIQPSEVETWLKVRHPELVQSIGTDLPIHLVERAWR